MSIFKGIFDEIKSEIEREMENNKSKVNPKTISDLESILFGSNKLKNSNSKNHTQNYNNQTNNKLKNEGYAKSKKFEEISKKNRFDISFEDKYGDSGYFGSTSKSTKNKSAMTKKKSEIEEQDLSYYDMVKDETKIRTINIDGNQKTNKNNLAKLFKNKSSVKDAFVASIIFERKI